MLRLGLFFLLIRSTSNKPLPEDNGELEASTASTIRNSVIVDTFLQISGSVNVEESVKTGNSVAVDAFIVTGPHSTCIPTCFR